MNLATLLWNILIVALAVYLAIIYSPWWLLLLLFTTIAVVVVLGFFVIVFTGIMLVLVGLLHLAEK